MNCHPKPEALCGTTIPETCVIIVDANIFSGCPAWLGIEVDPAECYRQSELNSTFAGSLCNIANIIGESGTCVADVYTPGTGILGSIYLGCLEDCDGNQIPLTVRGAIADLYSKVCALKVDLDLPLGNIDPKCLVDPCNPPITTLGPLLQALVDEVCDSVGTVGIYRAVLTQTGVTAPVVTVLENSLKFGNTLLTVTWARTGPGVYTGTITQPAFIVDKTFILVSPGNDITEYIAVVRTSTTVITVRTYINAVAADVVLTEAAVEIRLYP